MIVARGRLVQLARLACSVRCGNRRRLSKLGMLRAVGSEELLHRYFMSGECAPRKASEIQQT